MKYIYNIAIFSYGIIIRFFSLFNEKAELFVQGRTSIFQNLAKENLQNQEIVWVHCASLGEFEQARPLIEKIKEQTKYKVFLTFFSPSGYEIRKDYEQADWVYYLPLDLPSNAQKFIDQIQPKKVFFTKYEFWFNYLNEIKLRNIPLYSFSAKFRENQIFFNVYGSFFRKMLYCFSHFFVQDEQSKKLLSYAGIEDCTVNGDTRFDRVINHTKTVRQISEIERFKGGLPLLIIGSAWKGDMEVLFSALNKYKSKIKILIAPHEIKEEEINYFSKKLEGKSVKYTEWDKQTFDFDILFLDTIGILSSMYQYADFSYIGGAFGKGLHNILEAAAFGNPVVFGPNYTKFGEAIDLIELKGATSISNEKEFEFIFSDLLNKAEFRKEKSEICRNYVFQNEGATEEIMKFVFK